MTSSPVERKCPPILNFELIFLHVHNICGIFKWFLQNIFEFKIGGIQYLQKINSKSLKHPKSSWRGEPKAAKANQKETRAAGTCHSGKQESDEVFGYAGFAQPKVMGSVWCCRRHWIWVQGVWWMLAVNLMHTPKKHFLEKLPQSSCFLDSTTLDPQGMGFLNKQPP